MWPDVLHKCARRACYSLQRSGADVTIRKLGKLFRMSRGPWATSKFGKQLSDSRDLLLKGLLDGSFDHSVVESWLPAIARDHRLPVEGFGIENLIEILRRKSGL